MLYFTAVVKKSCKQGENLAEQIVVKTERYTDAAGAQHNKNIFGSKYTEGNVFGAHSSVLAPCDMQPGDEVDIQSADGIVLAVARDGKNVWENDTLLGAEDSKTAARLQARKEKRRQEQLQRGILPEA